jgi:alpha-tubulin suppressor-like RCC1 family protein
MTRVSIFLIMVAFIAGTVGCAQPAASYTLTIASTAGGSVTAPGEGTFTYTVGTMLTLVATPNTSCQFANWTGDVGAIGNIDAAATKLTMNNNYSIRANFAKQYDLAAGDRHTVGLKTDGTVVAVGWNAFGQCNIGGWTDIIQIAAGDWHTVGLKSNGTVVTIGWNASGQCDVGNWTDVIQVTAGDGHTVGLQFDGTAVAAGNDTYGECNVVGWTNIIQVAAGRLHTVGLKTDGTVVAVGANDYEQCDVGNWTDIVQVAAGGLHTVGLKVDGTVVAVGAYD